MSMPISKEMIEGRWKKADQVPNCKDYGIKIKDAEDGMYQIVCRKCANIIFKFEDRVNPGIKTGQYIGLPHLSEVKRSWNTNPPFHGKK